MKLTEAKVRTSKPGSRPVKLFDGGGLFLSVSTGTGGKHWRWAYRFEGKPKTMGFGQYPEVGLAKARVRHLEARRILESGIDPLSQRNAEKVAGKAGKTFKDVALQWHESGRSEKNPDYAAEVMTRPTRDVFPFLGDLRPSEIDAPKVVATIKKIEERGANEIATAPSGISGRFTATPLRTALRRATPLPT